MTQLWAVIRAWPIPMPVHANSSIIPTFFSTSCDMEAPYMVPRDDKIERFNSTKIVLNGTFCFSLEHKTPCILLKQKNLINWMDPLLYSQVNIGILASALNQIVQGAQSGSGTSNNVTSVNVTTLAMNTTLLVPMKDPSLREYNSTEFKASPHCVPDFYFPPTYTDCQGRTWEKLQIS